MRVIAGELQIHPYTKQFKLTHAAGDGDAIRRQAWHAMQKSVLNEGKVYEILKELPLMDLRVSEHGLIAMYDPKHAFVKRLWTLIIAESRCIEFGKLQLNGPLLSRVLKGMGKDDDFIKRSLTPGDKQNVPAAVGALWAASEASDFNPANVPGTFFLILIF